ncbi:uncharacterized protein BBA_04016 [Beauveria bassiana ARSEF 2860]|uniref:Myb-like domain-containing protein n=1 Tax=Beauveria bassiana (strain ARSEF 2860) TaxID=655819 RepID=J5JND4_BEAB2|nr:uncharacterized protein BBA_04016 [Beauveria bassiana ARSEF 2860]EJP66723.1 hypothetical protein BBA_04016 [Beauveria bassiana ARSEF 2860]
MSTDAITRTFHLAPPSHSCDDMAIATSGYTSPQMQTNHQNHHSFRSLRARRAQQNLTLPLHLRRRTVMDNDSWMQSMSDVEIETHYGRNFLHGVPRFDKTPLEHNHAYTASSSASQSTQNSSMPGSIYIPSRPPILGSSSNYNSPIWSADSHQLDFGGFSSAPMSAVWPQNNYTSYILDTSVSLPNTPAPVGIYQTPSQNQASRQMPHLNTPPTSAVSHAKMNSNDGVGKPQLKVDTGSHGYFKENGSIIMNKWFNNTTTQIAPPQIYNVPPPTSLSSQDSFHDGSSIASGRNIRPTSVRLHPSRSGFSSQLSLTNAADYSSQSPQIGYSAKQRLLNDKSPSPAIPGHLDAGDGSNRISPSGATSVGPSTYESDSNYAASSVRSSHASRLPSPALSDHNKNAQNAFLIDARARGMSYKEIRIKGGFTEAESTLRGRHRMLTKDKDSRVRKPEWTETDIELLRKAVRIHTRGNARTGKTSWKKVAEYITHNGGSYSFGFATCHNKWKELPPSRRR